MSTTLAPVGVPPDLDPDTRRAHPGVAITVAALVVVGAVATILAVGYVPLPAMPPLAPAPDPVVPEALAWTEEGDLAIATWGDGIQAFEGRVVAGGVVASAAVLGLLGTGPPWLLLRAAIVVVLAVVVVGRRPTHPRS